MATLAENDGKEEIWFATECPRQAHCSKVSFKKAKCWSRRGPEGVVEYVAAHLQASSHHSMSKAAAEAIAKEAVIDSYWDLAEINDAADGANRDWGDTDGGASAEVGAASKGSASAEVKGGGKGKASGEVDDGADKGWKDKGGGKGKASAEVSAKRKATQEDFAASSASRPRVPEASEGLQLTARGKEMLEGIIGALATSQATAQTAIRDLISVGRRVNETAQALNDAKKDAEDLLASLR